MHDLTLVFYDYNKIEGTEEKRVIDEATNGDKVFHLMGNKYAAIELIYEGAGVISEELHPNANRRLIIKANRVMPITKSITEENR